MTKNSAKRRSALDGLHHRLAAFAPESDPAAYEHHTQKYFEHCQPEGPVETHLVRVIAHTAWWLHRVPAIETNILNEAILRWAAGANLHLRLFDSAPIRLNLKKLSKRL